MSAERDMPLAFRIDSAEIVGDDSRVEAVVSRVGTVLRRGCLFDKIWNVISSRIRELASGDAGFEELV